MWSIVWKDPICYLFIQSSTPKTRIWRPKVHKIIYEGYCTIIKLQNVFVAYNYN